MKTPSKNVSVSSKRKRHFPTFVATKCLFNGTFAGQNRRPFHRSTGTLQGWHDKARDCKALEALLSTILFTFPRIRIRGVPLSVFFWMCTCDALSPVEWKILRWKYEWLGVNRQTVSFVCFVFCIVCIVCLVLNICNVSNACLVLYVSLVLYCMFCNVCKVWFVLNVFYYFIVCFVLYVLFWPKLI